MLAQMAGKRQLVGYPANRNVLDPVATTGGVSRDTGVESRTDRTLACLPQNFVSVPASTKRCPLQTSGCVAIV